MPFKRSCRHPAMCGVERASHEQGAAQPLTKRRAQPWYFFRSGCLDHQSSSTSLMIALSETPRSIDTCRSAVCRLFGSRTMSPCFSSSVARAFFDATLLFYTNGDALTI